MPSATEADLKKARDEFLAALKEAGVDILQGVAGNVDSFLRDIATSAVSNVLSGSPRNQRHVHAQILLAKMDAQVDLEESVVANLSRLVQMGTRVASGFLGLGVASLLGPGEPS